MKQSPLLDIHRAMGAEFTSCGDWEVAAHFGAPDTEYSAAREGCALFDLSCRGKLRVTGDDRRTFLHGRLTNDINGLALGQGVYAAALERAGRMLADMMVYALDDALLLDIESQACERMRATFEGHIIAEDVEVEDLSEAWGLLSLQGPGSELVLAKAGIGAPAEKNIVSASLAGCPLLVAGRRRIGLPGFDLFVATEGLADCWGTLVECGAVPAGWHTLDVLRVEAGIPWFGVDLDETVIPLEAGLEDAISYTKGCYVGQEIISRIHHLGQPARSLRGIVCEGEEPPAAGAPGQLARPGVGRVSSAGL